jgi:DNA-binding NarL/FixJ family response regulator
MVRLLARTADMEVVGQARNLNEALVVIQQHQPNVVVTDNILPPKDIIGTITEMKAVGWPVAILVLSMHIDRQAALAVLTADAAGYLLKTDMLEQLVEAVRAVHQGKMYVSPKVKREMDDKHD